MSPNGSSHEDVSAIYVTTLRRTARDRGTARWPRLGIEPRVERDLREVFLGEWEGGSFRRNVRRGPPDRRADDGRGPVGRHPGRRADAELPGPGAGGRSSRIAAAHPDQRVVVVVHGGVIGAHPGRRERRSGTAFAFVGADNGSITHVVVTRDRWIIRCYNDTSHLGLAFSTSAEPLT